MTGTTHVVKCFSTALVSEEAGTGRRQSTDRWAAKFEIGGDGQYILLTGGGDCPYQLNTQYCLSMQPFKEHT